MSLPASKPDTPLLIAQQVRQTVKKFKAKLRGKLLPISVSVGVCIVRRGTHPDAKLILETASEAKNQATAKGLSQVFCIDLSVNQGKDQTYDDHKISIDDALNKLKANGEKDVLAEMDFIFEKLLPIFKLMNNAQKQRLLEFWL